MSKLLSRKPPAVEIGAGVISVLSVSPFLDDTDALERILRPPQWIIHRAQTLKSAMAVLQWNRPPLVVCESNLGLETWREMLEQISLAPDPPFLIVASRMADEYLWVEALNLGVFDVLAKPFDATELTRTLSSAWLRWCHRRDLAGRKTLSRAASG